MLFVVDFDGTLSVRDTVDAMLEQFADPSWEDVEKEWLDGHITAVQCMQKQLRMVKADHVTLENFFRSIQLDATFLQTRKPVRQTGCCKRRFRSCDSRCHEKRRIPRSTYLCQQITFRARWY